MSGTQLASTTLSFKASERDNEDSDEDLQFEEVGNADDDAKAPQKRKPEDVNGTDQATESIEIVLEKGQTSNFKGKGKPK